MFYTYLGFLLFFYVNNQLLRPVPDALDMIEGQGGKVGNTENGEGEVKRNKSSKYFCVSRVITALYSFREVASALQSLNPAEVERRRRLLSRGDDR